MTPDESPPTPESNGSDAPTVQGQAAGFLPGDVAPDIVPTSFKAAPYLRPVPMQGPDGQPVMQKVPFVILRFSTPLGPISFHWAAENVEQMVVDQIKWAKAEAQKPHLELPPSGLVVPRHPHSN
jgi:hypothetical protein